MDKTKAITRDLKKIIEKYDLNYDQFNFYAKIARKEAGLSQKTRKNVQPEMPSYEDVKKFRLCLSETDPKYSFMVKVMFYLSLRVHEVVGIKKTDINISSVNPFIRIKGKGGSERNLPIPDKIYDELKLYLESHRGEYLFETRQKKQYTTRAIQDIFKRYKEKAQISSELTPHTLRHLSLTYLAGTGFTEKELQTQSRHLSSSALGVYTHLNGETIRGKLNSAYNQVII
jgi:integrase